MEKLIRETFSKKELRTKNMTDAIARPELKSLLWPFLFVAATQHGGSNPSTDN
jgi:hypothetical protein